MKKIMIVMAVCVLAVASCKKEEADKPYFLSADIDGVSFYIDTSNAKKHMVINSDYTFSYLPEISATAGPTLKIIEAARSDLSTFHIGIGNYSGKGSYALSNRGLVYWATDTVSNTQSEWVVDSTHTGTVIITSDAHSVLEGTFSADVISDGDSVKHITNGKFRVPVKH